VRGGRERGTTMARSLLPFAAAAMTSAPGHAFRPHAPFVAAKIAGVRVPRTAAISHGNGQRRRGASGDVVVDGHQ